MDANNLPYLNLFLGLMSVGGTLILIGKWIGAKDYLGKEVARLERDIEKLSDKIESLREDAKNDRHSLRKELLDKMEKYWNEVTYRMKWIKEDGKNG